MKITRIEVENFKSIEKYDFAVKDFNVFIGKNNHGKTNLFDALDWFDSGKTAASFYRNHQNELEIKVRIHFAEAQSGVESLPDGMHFRYMRNRTQALASEDALTLFKSIPDELDIAVESDARLRGTHIAKALQQLKSEYRETLVLRFFEGKSYDEISDILEMAPGTVATYIARGKTALEKILREMNITSV